MKDSPAAGDEPFRKGHATLLLKYLSCGLVAPANPCDPLEAKRFARATFMLQVSGALISASSVPSSLVDHGEVNFLFLKETVIAVLLIRIGIKGPGPQNGNDGDGSVEEAFDSRPGLAVSTLPISI
mmetsp:Transcript_20019/g.35575  ORF Transcript_20019/g.35575 Transcript_20019/m.35575 type:complete len:126 (+) Transcript_20019:649-1026(+)